LRRAFTILAALVFFFGSADVSGAKDGRMKWVASVYAGPEGIGLKHPEGVACGEGHFVVADTGNSRLLRYTYQGPIVSAAAAFPVPKSTPIVVQLNSKGDLYFLDGGERRIVSLSAAGEKRGFLTPEGLPSKAEIVPKSFRIDADDNIYILDIFSEQVLVLDPEAQYSRHVPFPEEYSFFSDIAVDQRGSIFLLDSVEAVVYSAARDAAEFAAVNESVNDYVNFPTRLSVDQGGTIYLVDQYGSGLALISQDGSFLGRKLGLGWKDGALYYPSQICINADGSVFIADRNNNRVQVFSVGGD
jgi:sugar lactone lactonase YvrE